MEPKYTFGVTWFPKPGNQLSINEFIRGVIRPAFLVDFFNIDLAQLKAEIGIAATE